MDYFYRQIQQPQPGFFPPFYPQFPFPGPVGRLDERVDRLERQVARLDNEVDNLRARVRRLENQIGIREG